MLLRPFGARYGFCGTGGAGSGCGVTAAPVNRGASRSVGSDGIGSPGTAGSAGSPGSPGRPGSGSAAARGAVPSDRARTAAIPEAATRSRSIPGE
ncbi:hypothetical protein GCM10009788_13570 [Nocardioides humi]|uniref:Uncharacterized protein n=1 Tax=Nocardioides humi TaxID=449461 RepID=A0ABN2A337_9ACTN